SKNSRQARNWGGSDGEAVIPSSTDGEGSPGRDPSLTFGMTTYRSAPVTANHLSSEPDITKMIGATHWGGSVTWASMSELPVVVAGKPTVVMLTVATVFLLSTRQLTSPRNVASSFVPTMLGGTDGSLAKTIPRAWMTRCQSVVSEPVALPTAHGSSSPRTPRI